MCLQHSHVCPSGHRTLLNEAICPAFQSTSYFANLAAPALVKLECLEKYATLIHKPSIDCDKCSDELHKTHIKAMKQALHDEFVAEIEAELEKD